MGIFFTMGESKKRPGVYQRYENVGGAALAGAVNGIAACTIKANWGPLGQVQTLDSLSAARHLYGDGGANGTTQVIEELFAGGAAVVKAVRLGSGGTKGQVALMDTTAETPVNSITMEAKYEGDRAFRYQIRTSLGDNTHKELVVYENNVQLEKLVFPASESGEVDALVAAGAVSQYFTFTKVAGYAGTGVVALVAEKDFTAGTNPTYTNENYAQALTLLEAARWNTLCLDTVETAVHALVAPYMNRLYQNGKLGFAVLGEPVSVDLGTRMNHAKAFNDYKVIYVGSGWYNSAGELVDGYRSAARIAGMVAAVPANESLTHRGISGATEVAEALTNSEYEAAIDSGMLTLSLSSNGVVWVESGITTLITPAGQDDDGWKKIKRAKIRFELLTRASDTVEPLVGKLNNNADGRATVIQAVQGVLNTMVAEEKLLAGASVKVDDANPPAGDSAWFVIQADDVDALEKLYLVFQFRFAPQA